MKAYYLVFFLTLLLSLVLPSKSDKQWRWKLFWTFLPLFIFGALRVDFGNDYSAYEDSYYVFHNMNSFIFDPDSHFEIGYQILCFVLPNFRLMLVLNSMLLCVALAVFIYRNLPREYLWVAIILIFLNAEKNIYGSLVGIRNGTAVMGFVFGSVLIQHRKWFAFLLLTLLLSTIHTSALVFLPLAYLVGRNTAFSINELIWWSVAIIILLMSSMSGLINIVTPFIENYFDRYEYYLNIMEGHRGILLTLSSLSLFALIFIMVWNNRYTWSPEQNSLFRLGLLYVCSAFLGSLAVRANYFFDMFFIGTVVLVFSKRGGKLNLVGWGLLLLAIIMSIYSMRLWQTNEWVRDNPLYWDYHSLIGNWNW